MAGRYRRLSSVAVAAGLAGVLAVGCGTAAGTDKTGNDTLVLSFGTIDNLNPQGQMPAPAEFIRKLTEVSGGKVKIEVKSEIGDGGGDADATLIGEIESGALDLGVPSVRGFATAGLPGFKALEAPLVLTSYQAQKEVAGGDLAARMLATLDGTKVVGLALTPGPLRRPMSTSALRSPENWHGIKFRSYSSVIQDAAITALGATPVRAGFHFPELADAGSLDGVELDIAQYAKDNYAMFPAVVRNVALWPRMVVFTMNRARFEALDDEQRGWIITAAADATKAAVAFDFDESAAVAKTCKLGSSYSDATNADLVALKQAVKPVVDSIAADPVAGLFLREVEATATKYPTSVPVVPRTCLKH